MVLTASNSPELLAVASPEKDRLMQEKKMADKTRSVKVLRAFYFKGQVQPVGAIVELPALFATEMVGVRKAEPAPAGPGTAPAAVPTPAADPIAEAPKPKRPKGGSENAEQ